MSPDLTFGTILGFRRVTTDPERLVAFDRAIGFGNEDPASIPADEMRCLGLAGTGSRVAMSLGPSRVNLKTFERRGRTYPDDGTACDSVFQHLALVTGDAEAAWGPARDAGATPIGDRGSVELSASSGGVVAVKVRDPEGHPLEFLQFPPEARSGRSGTGILGIDHNPISVGDVGAGIRFYERYGLIAGSATLNHGPAQARLDGLAGAEVDVVPMRPAEAPPHVELLGYRHPTGRASPPPDANDIAATRIVWRSDVDALIRDPDGHIHQFSARDRSPAGTAPPR